MEEGGWSPRNGAYKQPQVDRKVSDRCAALPTNRSADANSPPLGDENKFLQPEFAKASRKWGGDVYLSSVIADASGIVSKKFQNDNLHG